MSTRVYARTPLVKVLLGAFLICSLASLAVGQTTPQKEAQAIATIEEAVGVALKNADGRVISVSLVGNTGVDIESIDFSVFSHIESLRIHMVKTKRKKLSLAPFLRLPSGLRTLSILDADIDDEQLGQLLQKQKALMFLWLSRTKISDRSLAHIG